MPVNVEDIAEAAAAGVLRALDARSSGQKTARTDTAGLIASGFFVDVHIRAGGIRALPGLEADLNPQPLPPGIA